MRMRFLALAVALYATAVAPTPAAAQPDAGPTVEVRLRSVNDLLDRFEFVGGLAGKEDEAKQVRDFVRSMADDKTGIEGVDPKRPFGVYASLTKDVVDSPVVVMIPIASKDRFLGMLKDRIGVEPQKADGGALKANIPLPFLNEPVYLQFANDYLYVSPRAKAVDTAALVSPKTFFAKDDGAVASAVLRIDRIPDDLKTLVLGQIEMRLAQDLKKGSDGNPFEQKIKSLLFDTLSGGVKTLAADGKELTAKVFVDPKADDLSAEVVLTAKSGSTLSKTFAGLAGKTSLPAGIVAAENPVARFGVKAALPEDVRKQFAITVDDFVKEMTKQAKPNEQALFGRILTTLAPTAKAGELDAAATLSGPDAKGRYTLLAAAAVKDGGAIEKLAKDVAAFAPAEAVEFTFDAAKAGRFTLHKVEIKVADANFEKLFGTKTVWLATAEDCFALAIGPDGDAALKKAVAAKPAAAGLFVAEVSAARILPLVQPDLKPDEVKALVKDAYGTADPAGKDVISVRIEGGDQLALRVKAKGKAVRLGAGLDQLKGK
jgi:hypothetical protein